MSPDASGVLGVPAADVPAGAYAQWLAGLKDRIRSVQLGCMRAFAEAWPDRAIVQQLVGRLPWGHNLQLISKLDGQQERLWYAQQAIAQGWSRNVLAMQIQTRLHTRQGKAVTNFETSLPATDSDAARETLKDPYVFDFLGLTGAFQERDVERALTEHITRFLLELGAGFAFVGRQVRVEVAGDEFFIDLLFYHARLHCYVVVELKAGEFRPEYAGKLNFYLSAVDEQWRREDDGPTIGLLLCRERNRLVAEYALRDMAKPMGVAEYRLAQAVPDDLAAELPSIERIESALSPGSQP